MARVRAALRRERHTLKRSLTDPRLFSGIGNAYSDEILHAARLSPIAQTQKIDDEAIARLSIVVGKASYRVTEKMVLDVLGEDGDEARFIRILAWSSFSAARRFARIVASRIGRRGRPEMLSAA